MTTFADETLYYFLERSYWGYVYLLPDLLLETRTVMIPLHEVGER